MQQVQASIGEFFEDFNDALRESVRALGGHKKVGPQLWPELPQEQAANRLRDCLNPERREKLSPEQVLLILRQARDAGFHSAMAFVTYSCGYEAPRPVEASEIEADLQRRILEGMERQERLLKQLAALQQTVRRVA